MSEKPPPYLAEPQRPQNGDRIVHCAGRRPRDQVVEEAITTLLTTTDMEQVLQRIARLLRRSFGSTRVSITRLLDSPDQVEVLFVDDPHLASEGRQRVALAGSARASVVEQGRPNVVEALEPDGTRVREEAELAAAGYGSLACFPLLVDGRVIGTLDIAHPPRCGIFEHCMLTAEAVARIIAIALHNSLLLDEVRRLNRLLDRENSVLRDQIQQTRRSLQYVAESPLMREVMEKLVMVAPSDSTVLIRGETGTGKEGLAHLVHELSRRAAGPFVVVNLGAIPETLIESELFGHEKGAFTGATRRKLGRFEQASGGTLFLDEVGDAPLPVQVKLLRALQERRVERVGGEESVAVDVRVVAATNRSLERMLEEGTFRTDLYYRLSTFPIHLPPLRERREDLRPLALHLLERHAAAMHRRPPRVPDALWAQLEAYAWPGNVRELENYLERALILSPGPMLRAPLPAGLPDAPARGARAAPSLLSFDEEMRVLLGRALDASDGRIYGARGAAALLGLRPTTLQGKLRKYGVKFEGRRGAPKGPGQADGWRP
jgi:formate hydrogenlyase transcriptional activator